MPTSSKQDYLAVLQQLVAFAEGETLTIPNPVLKVGDGLLAANHHTNAAIGTATRQQREYLQKELQHYLRGVANGHASMIKPYAIRTEIVTHIADPPSASRRQRSVKRIASYLIEGSFRDWTFNLIDRVVPHVALEALRSCPGCGRAFVKITRKRYCSPRCQTRTYMRQRRADEKE